MLVLVTLAPLRVEAQDPASARHHLELAVGGGLHLVGDPPENPANLVAGGQLGARVLVDLVHARLEASGLLPDPSRPELFQLRGHARLLFVTLHDFTWRRGPHGELVRVLAGLGGEIDLGDVGHLMLDLGVALVRLGSTELATRPFSESYGGYAGVTLRLRVGEVRDELRVAVHGLAHPPVLGPGFSIDAMVASIAGGVTASNRFYVQVLREGVISLGPEVHAQLEMLLEGLVVVSTVGIAGTLGL